MRTAFLLSWILVPALASAQAPALDVTPLRLAFFAAEGSGAPVSQQVSIKAAGGGPLAWHAAPSAPWLRVTPSHGETPGILTVSIDATRLRAGSHPGRVTVSAMGSAGTAPVIVEISVQIAARKTPAPAALPARPSTPAPRDQPQTPDAREPGLELTAPAGSNVPVEVSVTVRSPREGPTEWFARPDRPWLTVEPRTGVTPSRVSVRANPAGLPAGTHTALLRFEDDAREVMWEVPVTLVVGDPGGGAAPPADQAPAAATPATGAKAADDAPAREAAGAPAAPPLAVPADSLPPAIRNLPYSQVIPITGGRPPFTVRIVSGRLPLGLNLVNGTLSGMTRFPGSYALSLEVIDSSTPPQVVRKSVTLPVIVALQQTALSVTHTGVSLVARPGQRAMGVGVGVASGGPPLGWSVSGDKPWLVLTPAQGVAPGVFQVAADASGLEPGVHVAVITVTMDGAPNSPMRIPVQVTVRR